MRNPSRICEIARDAGSVETTKLPILQQSQELAFQRTSDDDITAARETLIRQRTQSESWKDPLKQKRRFLRSKKKTEILANPEKWTFSRSERYEAINKLVLRSDRRCLGIVRSILDMNTPDEVFDVNLKYSDEQKTAPKENCWLEYVAGKGSLEYVAFLASCGTRQSAKDEALSIALERGNMLIIRELLAYHANPNNGLEDKYFIPAVVQGNLELVGLFLSAPNPLTEATLNAALIRAVEEGHSNLVSLLIQHGSDANYQRGKAIDAAVLNGSVKDLASICLKTQNTLAIDSFHNAMANACIIQNESLRVNFINLLLCAGADANHCALGDLLLQAVKAGNKSTVSLLIKHGTSPNVKHAECLKEAIRSFRLDLVEIILRCDISARGMQRALESIPDEVSENEFRNAAMLLVNKGVTDKALSSCLCRAVTKGFDCLALELVKRGASLDHDNAACVQHIVRQRKLSLLEHLLTAPCAPENLVKAIPEAMTIVSNPVRRKGMNLLLRKGVKGEELHRALHTVISEDNQLGIDYDLVELLLRHNASVNFICPGINENVLQIATKRGDLRAVELLCQAKPSSDTASAALSFVFKSHSSIGSPITYDILSLLTQHEVQNDALNETLVEAISQNSERRIIALLLEANADPNYKDGRAIEYALALSDATALRVICDTATLQQLPLERLVPQALDPRKYDIDKAGPLLCSCARYQSILNKVLVLEVESMGCRREVINLLLELGVSVNFNDAAALSCVVKNNDLEVTQLLLSKGPDKKHYLKLLQTATKTHGSKHEKFDMIRLLLSQGGPGVGQEDVLLEQIQSSSAAAATVTTAVGDDDDDISLAKLFLDHGASVDHQNGALIQTAVSQSRISLFDLLMTNHPNRTSLVSGFEAARRNGNISTKQRFHIFSSLMNAASGSPIDSEALSLAVIEAAERDPFDITIPELLLKHGATVEYDQGRALQLAVMAPSPLLVELFLRQDPSNRFVNQVFGRMISAGIIDLPGGFKVAQFLLEKGVQKSLIGNALSQVFSAASTTPTGYISKKKVKLFLSHGADVNAANATNFVQAALKEDMDLFRMLLLDGNPDHSIIIPALIESVAPEKTLVRYLRVLIDKGASSPVCIKSPTLFMAIERFPRGEELVRLLLEIDVSVLPSTTTTTIDPGLGIENVNLIVWALLRVNPRVSSEVIVAALQAGMPKEALFVTPKTRLSATILASKYCRHTVMRELIRQKADVSSRDHRNRSSLFYASRNGDVEMVRILNKAGALPDDGSLHEAARKAHPQIVSMLLAAGHDYNFPSLLHSDEGGSGRTPLEELCLRATSKGLTMDHDENTWNTRLRETMRLLLNQYKAIKKDAGSNSNKSILHLALDNARDAVDVTEALLEFPQIWKFINEPIHEFVDTEGCVYSPTKYVEYYFRAARPSNDENDAVAKTLIQLLRGKRCQDRYYSSQGYDDQPEHAVGIPDDIVAAITRRQRQEHEQKQEMARIEELAEHRRDVRMKDHQLELRISKERHEQSMKHAREQDTYEQYTIQSKHMLALAHDQEFNQQHRIQLEEESRLKRQLLSEESIQQESLLEASRSKELQYKKNLLIQERDAEETKIRIQKQIMWERDKVDQKQHGRQIQLLTHQDQINEKQHSREVSLLARQDQSVRNRAIEARSVAEVARAANMPSKFLQLEGPD